jgi:UDP-glucose 4-epimerase
MKILLVGGAGFIGSNLLELLLRKREVKHIAVCDNLVSCTLDYVRSITGTDFSDSLTRAMCRGKTVSVSTVDARHQYKLMDVARGAGAVVHLAATPLSAGSVDNPLLALDNDLKVTVNVLETVRLMRIPRMVYLSCYWALGESPSPAAETAAPRPCTPFGGAKLAAEALCRAYSACYGPTITALRVASAYGPYSEHKNTVVAKMLRERIGGSDLLVQGDGSQERDFVHASDVALAVWFALRRRGAFEIYNVGSGTTVSVNRIVSEVNACPGPRQNVAFAARRKADISSARLSIDKIRRELGFKPSVELSGGIAGLYARFRSTMAR